MSKVLVSASLNAEGLDILRRAGLEVLVSEPLSGDELVRALADCEALIVRSETKVTADVLSRCPALRVVGRAGSGVDNIDVAAATERGVVVMNALGGNTVTTAEHTFALMLACARRIPQAHAEMTQGLFNRKHRGIELEGKTLGVIGLGQIGAVLTAKARGFGMEVVGHDPYCTEERAAQLGVSLLTLDDLLARADVVSVHVPLTPETGNLIDASRIERMKAGALLINCARGGLVDEKAVRQALDAGKLAGAAFDVYCEEPPPRDHPLVGHPKCVTTPHLGAATAEAQLNVAVAIAEQVAAFLTGGAVRGAVNLPAISPKLYAELKPFVTLADRLGSFLAQVSRTTAISGFTIRYLGEVARKETEMIRRAALAGYLRHQFEDVNPVNAPAIAERTGIEVSEQKSADPSAGQGTVRLFITSKLGVKSVSGTVYDAETSRISRYDGFHLDAAPTGTLLVSRNDDVPGVVGALGTLLGKLNVNIAAFHLGRQASGGEAVALIEVDSAPTPEQMAQLAALEHVRSIKLVVL